MPKIKKSISVVLPAYNEKENIVTCINAINSYLIKKFTRYEILVVDGGSTDGTDKKVRLLMVKNPHLRLIKSPKGYGIQLSTGFLQAKHDFVFYTDSDNQFDINDLDKLLPLINKYDMVCGYRINRQDPLMRKIIAKVYNILIRLVLELEVKDVDCSFKLYRKKVFNTITLTSQTGMIDAEILAKALKAGFTFTEIGVSHYPRTKGQTIYEIGGRNKIFAFVKPQVIVELLKELHTLHLELQ